ncbi:MAG: SpoVG family protein, partial [Oscillospiraceae bacterium]|nr:SpoVG family protein [Oscillospiraceae bacterium]
FNFHPKNTMKGGPRTMQFDVRIHRVFDNAGAMKAVGSVSFDGMFVVHGLKVIETEKGRFVAMPSEVYTDKNGKEIRRDVFHPFSSSAGCELEEAFLAEYDATVCKEAATATLAE